MYSNGITVSFGEAVEDQIEAKSAVPWLQHSTYDYENQPSASFFPTSDILNHGQLNGTSGEPMEVDESKDDSGFSLDQLLNVSKDMDIGQVSNLLSYLFYLAFSCFSKQKGIWVSHLKVVLFN
jgi:hypothetical protein